MSPTDKTPGKPDSAKKSGARLKLSRNQIRSVLLAAIALSAAGISGYWWETHKAHPASPVPQTGKPSPQPAAVADTPAASSPVASGPITESSPKAPASETKSQQQTIAGLREAEMPPLANPSQEAAKPPRKAARKPEHKPESAAPEEPPAPEAPGAASEESAPPPPGGIDKQEKQLTPQQLADNEFRRANGLAEQGKADEAEGAYEAALHLDPDHEAARQALAVLLIGSNRHLEAERLLQEGLNRNLKNTAAAMLLARLELERDAAWTALLTLQKSLPYAEQQADYQAFVAGLLQRLNHHKEAVAHYREAVRQNPNSGVWYMGLGISLQALQRYDEARDAFQHALDTRSLNADLDAFTTQRLKELKRR